MTSWANVAETALAPAAALIGAFIGSRVQANAARSAERSARRQLSHERAHVWRESAAAAYAEAKEVAQAMSAYATERPDRQWRKVTDRSEAVRRQLNKISALADPGTPAAEAVADASSALFELEFDWGVEIAVRGDSRIKDPARFESLRQRQMEALLALSRLRDAIRSAGIDP